MPAGRAGRNQHDALQQPQLHIVRDIAPVAGILRVPAVMVVHPSVPAKTVPEFIAYAKANPGKINVESPGAGTSSHLAGELFKLMTGVDITRAAARNVDD